MINSPLGINDLLPQEACVWDKFNAIAKKIFSRYGYREICTPIVEQKDLFVRGIGNDTDVVSKEMFNVLSDGNLDKLKNGQKLKSKSCLSLRPEGTAGVVRAVIQHSLATQQSSPVKLMYSGTMFRAERPSMGRYRQFRQLGVECIGADNPSVDAEAVIMMMRLYQALGFDLDKNLKLVINSVGCKTCRKNYKDVLGKFLNEHKGEFCETCIERISKNPMRVLDCKSDKCQKIIDSAPKICDYLCDDCRDHFLEFKQYLDFSNIRYVEDFKLVRGLDYYSSCVFELRSNDVGSQDALAGGGRYDGLVKLLEGPDLCGFGFAIGFERSILALKNIGKNLYSTKNLDVFVVCADKSCKKYVFNIAQKLRDNGFMLDFDHQNRSVKSQFKLAGKLNVEFCVIVGPDELKNNCISVRNMLTHTQENVDINNLMEYLQDNREQ